MSNGGFGPLTIHNARIVEAAPRILISDEQIEQLGHGRISTWDGAWLELDGDVLRAGDPHGAFYVWRLGAYHPQECVTEAVWPD